MAAMQVTNTSAPEPTAPAKESPVSVAPVRKKSDKKKMTDAEVLAALGK
jgi:hypothetical protein